MVVEKLVVVVVGVDGGTAVLLLWKRPLLGSNKLSRDDREPVEVVEAVVGR